VMVLAPPPTETEDAPSDCGHEPRDTEGVVRTGSTHATTNPSTNAPAISASRMQTPFLTPVPLCHEPVHGLGLAQASRRM
jgi:hypothetical protein